MKLRSNFSRAASCAAALVLVVVMLLTACSEIPGGAGTGTGVGNGTGTGGGTGTPTVTGGNTSTGGSTDAGTGTGEGGASNSGGSDTSTTIKDRPAAGTVLAYGESVTGQLLAKCGSNYTMVFQDIVTQNGKTTNCSEYYTTDGTRTYIKRTSSDDGEFLNLHVLYVGNKVGYVLNEKTHVAGKYTNNCVSIHHPLESIREKINGQAFTVGEKTINGTAYYCETVTVGANTYQFCYNSSNTLKDVLAVYSGYTERYAVSSFSLGCNADKFSLKKYGYEVSESINGVSYSYAATF